MCFLAGSCQVLGGDERIELFQFLGYTGEKYWVSHELTAGKEEKAVSGIFGIYGPQNLFDRDSMTCWVSGPHRTPGTGGEEDITIDLVIPDTLSALMIWNGAQTDPASYNRRGRVKDMDLMVYVGVSHPSVFPGSAIARIYEGYLFGTERHRLEDRSGRQVIPFPYTREDMHLMIPLALRSFQGRYGGKMAREGSSADEAHTLCILRIRLLDTYPGSEHDYPCLSEIRLR